MFDKEFEEKQGREADLELGFCLEYMFCKRCETEAEEILKAEDEEQSILDEQNSNYVRDSFDWRR